MVLSSLDGLKPTQLLDHPLADIAVPADSRTMDGSLPSGQGHCLTIDASECHGAVLTHQLDCLKCRPYRGHSQGLESACTTKVPIFSTSKAQNMVLRHFSCYAPAV